MIQLTYRMSGEIFDINVDEIRQVDLRRDGAGYHASILVKTYSGDEPNRISVNEGPDEVTSSIVIARFRRNTVPPPAPL